MIFSNHPETAEQQMMALIVYLTTLVYIDGDFDLHENVFVHEYIHKLVHN